MYKVDEIYLFHFPTGDADDSYDSYAAIHGRVCQHKLSGSPPLNPKPEKKHVDFSRK